jgi:hypothetical protein
MAITYKMRKRLVLAILLIGLPVYVIVALNVIALIDRPSFLIELFVYVGLGLLWIVPMKPLFMGIGQPDPDAGDQNEKADGQ